VSKKIVWLVSIIIVLVIAGCGQAPPPPPTPVPPTATSVPPTATVAPTPTKVKTVLKWLDYKNNVAENEAIDSVIGIFEAEHPDIDIQRKAVAITEFMSNTLEAKAKGEVYDIMILDNPNHHSLADQGILADITDYLKDWPDKEQYFEGPWKSTVYKGRNFGVPFSSNATTLFYNEDMFAEVGLKEAPKNWTELRDYAKKLTKEGQRWGFCLSNTAEAGTFTFLPFLWQAGGDIPTVGDAASIKALTLWLDLVNDKSTPSEPIGTGETYKRFAAGKCAMMINGPWQLPNFKNDGVTLKWKVAPWPSEVQSASILGGENFALGTGPNVAVAWELLKWMATPKYLKPMVLPGNLPNRKDMANDPDWIGNPSIKIFVEQVAIARPRAYGVNYPKISVAIQKMIRNVVEGKQTPEQAAKEAGETIKPLLP